ncbi:MAG: hypothetical protein CMJ07_08335 [Pelagibacterales bacterium]|nr:hypothetical protein [Pelagibacterales bacterium]OUV26175.1 MAG: hypothetical protein CBC69_06170 [Alphaproteobacteria bacterium TMED109]
MKKIIYVLIGILIGLLVSLLLFQPRLDYFFDDESELIDNEMKIYDDDDDDDYEINRVEYYKGKLAIKLSDDEIKDAGIIVSKLTQDKITLEEEINAISIGYKNLLDVVSKYDVLNLQLSKSKINKTHNERIYLRLKSLYDEHGSIALKDLEEVEFKIESIKADMNSIQKDMDFLISEIKLEYGSILMDDVLSERKIFTSLINNSSSLLVIENVNLTNKNRNYKFNNEELIFLNPYNGNSNLRGNVAIFLLQNIKISSNSKLTVFLENEDLIEGYFIPESALLYHGGKVWAYFRENNEIFYKEEITNFYNIDNNKVFSTNSLLNLNIVVSGAQILLAEEFRSQIMQEDDD